MKKDTLSARKQRVKAAVQAAPPTKSGGFMLTTKDGVKIATRGGSVFTRKDAAKAHAKIVKGELHIGGHRVAGVMPDGTPILEPVSKPTSFTRKEIKETVRGVRSKGKSKLPHNYAD